MPDRCPHCNADLSVYYAGAGVRAQAQQDVATARRIAANTGMTPQQAINLLRKPRLIANPPITMADALAAYYESVVREELGEATDAE